MLDAVISAPLQNNRKPENRKCGHILKFAMFEPSWAFERQKVDRPLQ